ncbi:PAS domain S-box protein [Desulfococcaceae bacterium HSG7]|nr:PAS domain S-box protein [Desulfococcaceae bacterium HSG7]
MNLKRKIFYQVTGLLFVLILSVTISILLFNFKEHRLHEQQILKNNVVFISQQCEKFLMWDDRLGIKTLLKEVVLNDNVIDYAFIIKQGKPYIHTFDKGFPKLLLQINANAKSIPGVVRLRNENNEIMYDVAILINNSKAVLHIGMSQKKIDRQLYLPISKIILISLLILGIGLLLAAWVAALVTRETDRMTAKLRLNEEKLRLIIENSTNLFYAHTLEHEMTYISPQIESILGYKPDEVIVKLTDLASDHPVNKKGFAFTQKAIATSQAQPPYELELVHKNSRKVWVAVNEAPVVKNGKTASMVGSLTDITERKQAEQALRKSEEHMRNIIENMPVMMDAFDDKGVIIAWNRECEHVTGFSKKEIIGNPDVTKLLYPDENYRTFLLEKSIEYGNKFKNLEWDITCKDGNKKTILWSNISETHPIPGWYSWAVGINISEQKKKEQEIRKLSKVVETSSQAVAIIDLETRIVYVNQGLLKNSSFENDELIGKPVLRFSDEEGAKLFHEEIMPTLLSEGAWQGEISLKRKDGTLFPTDMNCSVICTETGEPEYLVAIYNDITDRKRSEHTIKAALEEKEVLLREIHHRVKNNLQIIISLLNLQSKKITNKIALESLTESNNRIRAMSLIHEILYQSDDLAKIDFETYINRLIKAIVRAFAGSGGNISYSVKVTQIRLSIDDAVPIALIINELLTNIYKYAFPANRRGKVEITLKKSGPQVMELSISDNGIGLPADIDIHHSETLGLQLVSDLAEDQLEGSLQIEHVNGTRFVIKFKPQKTGGKE